MGKMFKTVTRTWNVFTGCEFGCTYCWVDQLLKGRLRDTVKYRDIGKKPMFHPKELRKTFKPGEFVFVAAMGDIRFMNYTQLKEVLIVVQKYPDTNFLLQTKDPAEFLDGRTWEINIYQGSTFETNRTTALFSKAPEPVERYHYFALNNHPHKFISIEPVMDFDLDIFTSWILDINPDIVEVGADNYHNNLPEPPWDKVESLMSALREVGIKVVEKDGLRRLQNSTPNIRG